MQIVYAKKALLPSAGASILQSLNMALAFEAVCPGTQYYPCVPSDGCKSKVLREALKQLGTDVVPSGWHPITTRSKGWYGARFRFALAKAWFNTPGGLFYARDVGEAGFLALLQKGAKRTMLYEAHEILYLMHQAAGKTASACRETQKKEQRICRAASGIVAVSELVAEDLQKHLGYRGPLLVAPNAFNPLLFKKLPLFAPSNPWPAANDPVVIVYIGKFHQGKGVEELLKAMCELPERFHLRIIGGAPDVTYQSLKDKAAAPNLSQRVTFLGELPQNQLYSACSGAHVFVIPQQSEFYFAPLKLYEALALGLPIVSTPLSVFQPYGRDGLVHMAPGLDPKSLAAGISWLATHPEAAKQQRERGLLHSMGHSWQARVKNILAFADSI